MESYTFGDSKAAISLIKILNEAESEWYVKKAVRILSKYFKALASLSHIPDKGIRETSYKIWREHFMESVDKTQFPTIVGTHMKCVIVGEYRKAMRFSH